MYTLLENALIHTMDAAMPHADAAIVHDGRFAYAGTQAGARLWLAGKAHHTIDAQGCSVIPGFNDAHMHYLHTALRSKRADLTGITSIAGIQDKLRRHMATATEPTQLVIGEGWNQEGFDERRMPTRADLDLVSHTKPILAVRACGHIAVSNSAALEMAGINPPDGLLREDEQGAVWALEPQLTVDALIAQAIAAQQGLFAKGITSIQTDDLGSVPWEQVPDFLHGMLSASEDGRLAVRYSEQALMGSLSQMEAFFAKGLHRIRGGRFHVSCMKLMADGSLGARTAWMQQPYADAPGEAGIAMYTDAQMQAFVRCAVAQGMPVAVHVIGDAAMEQVLNAVELHGQGLRHALVHAQVSTAGQVIRCGKLEIGVMAQPIFLDADIPIIHSRVGETLADSSYRWKTMQAAGAKVAFSTDCPVEPYDPMPNLYCAVTRKGLTHSTVYLPEEAYALEEALYAYTAAGAYLSGEEEGKGRIRAGMLADFVILDRALDTKTPEAILETGVAATYVGGKCVYSV